MTTIPIPKNALSFLEIEVTKLHADPEAHGLEPDEVRKFDLLMGYLNLDTAKLRVRDKADLRHVAATLTDLSSHADALAEASDIEAADESFYRDAAQGLATMSLKAAKAG